MTLHIGIVGCSSEGAALCYRTICAEGAQFLGRYEHPEVSMHTPSLARYVDCLARGDWDGVGDLMLVSAEKLAAAGAQILVCPDNTIHSAFPYVKERSPLPWLHIAEVVAEQARNRGYRKLGVLGTQWLMESDVYPAALAKVGATSVVPTSREERSEISAIIMDELVKGIETASGLATLIRAIDRLKARGCDALVLGCTELPLVLNDDNSPLPTLDSTRLLARAALARAMQKA
jgi:aspartate racemase